MATTSHWHGLPDEGDASAREALVTEHLGLVHHVARQLSRSLALEAEFDELVSCGTMGLMKALASFDASRGLAFSTFAAPRIRGAILDELRRQDHVPRSVRRKARDIASARKELMNSLGREPEDAELARHLSIDMVTYWRWQSETEGSVHVPLDAPALQGHRGSRAPADVMTTRDDLGIEDLLNHEEEVGSLRDAIMELKEQERLVLSLYYYEDLKLHQIASIMGVTESRVSQIRSKAISRLRSRMAHLREEIFA
jgi:RNA polymerase sigma factor for flagellar operon FliA